jgi:hypothetical protein
MPPEFTIKGHNLEQAEVNRLQPDVNFFIAIARQQARAAHALQLVQIRRNIFRNRVLIFLMALFWLLTVTTGSWYLYNACEGHPPTSVRYRICWGFMPEIRNFVISKVPNPYVIDPQGLDGAGIGDFIEKFNFFNFSITGGQILRYLIKSYNWFAAAHYGKIAKLTVFADIVIEICEAIGIDLPSLRSVVLSVFETFNDFMITKETHKDADIFEEGLSDYLLKPFTSLVTGLGNLGGVTVNLAESEIRGLTTELNALTKATSVLASVYGYFALLLTSIKELFWPSDKTLANRRISEISRITSQIAMQPTADWNASVAQTVLDLNAELLEFRTLKIEGQDIGVHYSEFAALLSVSTTQALIAKSILSSDMKRIHPVSILMCGAPATFKTTLCDLITRRVIQSANGRFDASLIYRHTGEDDRMDGASNHTKAVIFDDFLQNTECQKGHANLFRMAVGFDDFKPDQSALDRKGNVHINPYIVLASTNYMPKHFLDRSTSSSLGLVSQYAFVRRIDYIVKPEWDTRYPCPIEIDQQHVEEFKIAIAHLKIRLFTATPPRDEGQPFIVEEEVITFNEFYDERIFKVLKHRIRHKDERETVFDSLVLPDHTIVAQGGIKDVPILTPTPSLINPKIEEEEDEITRLLHDPDTLPEIPPAFFADLSRPPSPSILGKKLREYNSEEEKERIRQLYEKRKHLDIFDDAANEEQQTLINKMSETFKEKIGMPFVLQTEAFHLYLLEKVRTLKVEKEDETSRYQRFRRWLTQTLVVKSLGGDQVGFSFFAAFLYSYSSYIYGAMAMFVYLFGGYWAMIPITSIYATSWFLGAYVFHNKMAVRIRAYAVILICSIVAIAYYMYFAQNASIFEQESNEHDKRKKPTPKKVPISEIVNEGDSNSLDLVSTMYVKNMGTMTVFATKGSDANAITVNYIGLFGNIFATVGHVFDGARADTPITFMRPGQTRVVTTYDQLREIKSLKDSDITFFRFGHDAVRDIRRHFIESADLSHRLIDRYGLNYSELQIALPTYNDNQPTIRIGSSLEYEPPNPMRSYRTSESPAPKVGMILSQGISQSGDCGAPWIVQSSKWPRKIVGLHVGSIPARHKMAAVPIFREQLDQLYSAYYGVENPIVDYRLQDENLQEESHVEPAQPEDIKHFPDYLRVISKVNKGYSIHMPEKSDIYPSVLQKMDLPPEFKVITKPANLSIRSDPLGRRPDAYFLGKQRYDCDKSATRFIHLCGNLLGTYEAKPLLVNVPSRLSPIEVINGVPASNVNGCNQTTSPGWPWVKLPGVGKRKVLDVYPPELGECGDETKLTACECPKCVDRYLTPRERSYLPDWGKVLVPKPFFKKRILECIELLEKKCVPNWIYTTVPKDELRDINDIDTLNKTRYIQVCPFDQYIVTIMYFGGWLNTVKTEAPLGPSMVGTNVQGMDFQYMWIKLNEIVNPNFICGDFKGFDIRLFRELREITGKNICDRMHRAYGNELHDSIRRTLWEASLTIVALHGNLIYARSDGKPSGDPFTAEENSENNKLMVFSIFIYTGIQRGYSRTELLGLWQYGVRPFFYGDDHIIAVSPALDWFNQRTLQEGLKLIFSMEYTDATKNQQVAEYTPREQISFLKKYFRSGPHGRVFPIMEVTQILQRVLWIRVSAGEDAVPDNMDDALRDLYFHGRPTFEKYKTIFDRILQEKQFKRFTRETWDSCRDRFYSTA